MKKIINQIINDSIEGVDVYHRNGSIWLIFTDKKEWVIELEKKGNLLYRYSFFHNLFKYVSMDVIENQHYITEWVEDSIQNGVMKTFKDFNDNIGAVEDAIQNGVMKTNILTNNRFVCIEDAIQNGVMSTFKGLSKRTLEVEDIIEWNGNKLMI